MSFPVGPTNGQKANVNGVTYTYSTALTAWTVTSSFLDSFTGNLLLANNATIANTVSATAVSSDSGSFTGNVTAGNLTPTNALAVEFGGTSTNTATGTGSVVLSTSPALVTPDLGTPSAGTLSNCTVDGTSVVGFRVIPQVSQSAAYDIVLTDSGKHILHPSADTTARTWTIPANSNVAFPVGTAITFVNQNGAGNVSIAITTDTMRLAGAGTTGTRTLTANGVATAIKITTTEWIISGVNLT